MNGNPLNASISFTINNSMASPTSQASNGQIFRSSKRISKSKIFENEPMNTRTSSSSRVNITKLTIEEQSIRFKNMARTIKNLKS